MSGSKMDRNCPPRMSDGRLFTDYRPRCDINYIIPPTNELIDSYNYRQFLIQNADVILNEHRKNAYAAAACLPCSDFETMLPEQTIQKCNSKTCAFVMNDPVGLGLGRSQGEYDPELLKMYQASCIYNDPPK